MNTRIYNFQAYSLNTTQWYQIALVLGVQHSSTFVSSSQHSRLPKEANDITCDENVIYELNLNLSLVTRIMATS